jgi:hypothetical protein
LDEQNDLQFVLEETLDINHQRVANLAVVVPGFGSFYLENEHVGVKALNALFFVDWFFGKTKHYCLNPKRISSLSTDTCATMQKT